MQFMTWFVHGENDLPIYPCSRETYSQKMTELCIFDISMKLCTHIIHHVKFILRYTAIVDLTFGDLSGQSYMCEIPFLPTQQLLKQDTKLKQGLSWYFRLLQYLSVFQSLGEFKVLHFKLSKSVQFLHVDKTYFPRPSPF